MGINSFPRLLRGITITVCLLVTVVTQINVVHAGAKWQAFSWGDVNGTVLSDGVLKICANPFLMNDARFTNYLKHMHRDMTPFFSPMNIVVLDVHGKRVMVDTGSFVPREQRVGAMSHCGALPDSMQEAQIGYDSIDAVMLTHGHPDHIMGLLNSDGEPAFPKANVYISALDHNYFWSGDSEPSGDPMQRALSGIYTKYVAPYKKANRLVLVNDGESPVPGVTYRLTPGHTPGHSAVEVSANNRPSIIVAGDAWALQPLQGVHPDVEFALDVNKEQAAETRKTLYPLLAADGNLVLSYHEIFPGLGFFDEVGHANGDGPSVAHWIIAPIDELQSDILALCG